MNVGDVLKYGHEMVIQAVDGLADPDWLTPGVCGIWTVKDVIAHLGSAELLVADVLATFVGSGPTPYLDAFTSYGHKAEHCAQISVHRDRLKARGSASR